MFCNKCGHPLPEESLFCPSCGAKVTVVPQQQQPVQQQAPQPVQQQPVQQPVSQQPYAATGRPAQFAAAGQPAYRAPQNFPPAPRRNNRTMWLMLAGLAAVIAVVVAIVCWPKSDNGGDMGSTPRSTVERFMKAWKDGNAEKMLSCATPRAAERNRSHTYEILDEVQLISYQIIDEQMRGDEASVKARVTVHGIYDDETETNTITYRLELVDGRWLIRN